MNHGFAVDRDSLGGGDARDPPLAVRRQQRRPGTRRRSSLQRPAPPGGEPRPAGQRAFIRAVCGRASLRESAPKLVLVGVAALTAGLLLYLFTRATNQTVEPWSTAAFAQGPVIVLQPVTIMPAETVDRPFIEGKGEYSQGSVSDSSNLADAATRCGAPVALVDLRTTHVEYAVLPARGSPFYEPNFPLSNLDLVKCIQKAVPTQFEAGIAKDSSFEATVSPDRTPFASLTTMTAKRSGSPL